MIRAAVHWIRPRQSLARVVQYNSITTRSSRNNSTLITTGRRYPTTRMGRQPQQQQHQQQQQQQHQRDRLGILSTITNELYTTGWWTTGTLHHPHGCPTATRTFSTSSTTESMDDATAPSETDTGTTSPDQESSSAPSSFRPEISNLEDLEFKAETRQLLDIVTHSLYTDKEIFLRELVSNASDACEKLRHLQATNAVALIEPDVPLDIRIDIDEMSNTITIADSGLGMTREDMISNLGTIARSGSKQFLQELQQVQPGVSNAPTAEDPMGVDPIKGIIGRFGVGFYSSFMVADRVEVRSRSALKEHENDVPKVWASDGTGKYQVGDLPADIRLRRGTAVVLHLKDKCLQYSEESKIEDILKRYSNFVSFPIYLNGKRVNTQEAIWGKDPKEVKTEEYESFYRYITNALDTPFDVYHFRTDAPIEIKALFYIPSFHSEKYGMGRMEPGVSVYSRKILIERKSADILPDWMRFVKGVVDSEDLPLSISREKPQDSVLIAKLRSVLTRKFIAHLTGIARKNRKRYVEEFYEEYSFFIKEGICQDYEFQTTLAKLYYFESSKTPLMEVINFDEYIARMKPEQKDIYYLVAPSRETAINSPYLEAFEKVGVEVIFLYSAIDDFVMANLEKYQDRKLVAVEQKDIDLSTLAVDPDYEINEKPGHTMYESEEELSSEAQVDLCNWFRDTVGEDKVATCIITNRLTTFPAIMTDTESGAMRRTMRLIDTSDGKRDSMPLAKQHVELNPKHPVIVGMNRLKSKEPALAKVMAQQIFDNCLVAAGLLDDSRTMLPRLNDILVCLAKGALANTENKMPSVVAANTLDSNDEVIASVHSHSEELTTTATTSDPENDSQEIPSPSSNEDERAKSDL